jgi:hypothetical protein
MNINELATKVMHTYYTETIHDPSYVKPYGTIDGGDIFNTVDDPEGKYNSWPLREATIKIIDDRIKLRETRLLRDLVHRGILKPLTDFNGASNQMFSYNGQAYQIPKSILEEPPSKVVGQDRTKWLESRISRFEYAFNDHFTNPRCFGTATINGDYGTLPRLYAKKRSGNRWSPLNLHVHTGWDKMQKLSTPKFLYAARINPRSEDEIIDDDVRVCDVWAWAKTEIRALYQKRDPEEVGDEEEATLVPLVLAYNYTSSSLVSNRSRAIQSIRIKTKNRVATSLWG